MTALLAVLLAASPALSAPISVGQTLTSQRFEWRSEFTSRIDGTYGQYEVSLSTGRVYEFFTSNPSGAKDTYLYLLSPGGAKVAEDDDSGGNYQAKIVYSPPASGTYRIRLRAYTKGASGYCSLTARAQGTGAGGGQAKLPDLFPWKKPGAYMYDAIVVMSGGRKYLRFSNAPTNAGQGPLELFGRVAADGTTQAYQRVFYTDGSYVDRLAGTFFFDGHEGHNHFHFADFAAYRLRAVASGDGVGAILRESDKVSFALLDVAAYDLSLPGAPRYGYYAPPGSQSTHQGISVGWADVYGRNLADQGIDITGLADGTYWLESEIDPRGLLLEATRSNNVARLKLQLQGSLVSVIESPTPPTPPPPPPPGGSFVDDFDGADRLITNSYAFVNPGDPAARLSDLWEATRGSLFSRSSQAWTGTPDNVAPNAASSNGTGSAIFRLRTRRSDFAGVDITFTLTNLRLVTTSATPAVAWDGVHLIARQVADTALYSVSVNRRDNRAVIKKRAGTSWYTLSQAAYTVPYGVPQAVRVSVRDNADGSVTVTLMIGGTLITSATDAGTGGAPYRSLGKLGLWGDNAEFRFDSFVAAPAGSAPSALIGVTPGLPQALEEKPPYPNPWRADRHAGLPVRFTSGGPDARVTIVSTSGRVVRTLDCRCGDAEWDLLDGDGRRVASGLYVYLIRYSDGRTRRGTVAVVR